MNHIYVLAIIAGLLPIVAAFTTLAVMMWRDIGPAAVFTWLGLCAAGFAAAGLLAYGITGISR